MIERRFVVFGSRFSEAPTTDNRQPATSRRLAAASLFLAVFAALTLSTPPASASIQSPPEASLSMLSQYNSTAFGSSGDIIRNSFHQPPRFRGWGPGR